MLILVINILLKLNINDFMYGKGTFVFFFFSLFLNTLIILITH